MWCINKCFIFIISCFMIAMLTTSNVMSADSLIKNLSVTEVEDLDILVEWELDLHTTEIGGIKVQCQGVVSIVGKSDTSYLCKNGAKFLEYTVSITLLDAGNSNDVESKDTKIAVCGIDGSKVPAVHGSVANMSRTEVLVTWDVDNSVYENITNGVKVTLQSLDEHSDYLNSITVAYKIRSASFNDLTSYTKYNASIIMDTKCGDSALYSTTITTNEDVPGKPVIKTYNINLTNIYIEWEPPTGRIPGILQNYQISWTGQNLPEVVDSNILSANYDFTFGGCEDITVNVAASTNAGYGEADSQTKVSPVSAPPPPESSLSKSSSTWLQISWTKPDTACDITDYNIAWSGEVGWGNHELIDEVSKQVENNVVDVNITDLIPYSNYIVCISAGTSAGQGQHNCLSCLTSEDVATEPEVKNITQVNDTSLFISWDVPESENGVIVDYVIEWSAVNSTSLESLTTKNRNYILTHLTPCLNYTISVAANNGAGKGDEDVCFSSTIPEELDAPNILQCLFEQTSCNLTWEQNKDCYFEAFQLSVLNKIKWSGEENTTTYYTDYSTTSYAFGPLPADSDVTISVSTYSNGQSGKSAKCQGITPEAKSSVPQHLEVTDVDSSSFLLKWKEPEQKNGNVQQYNIHIEGKKQNYYFNQSNLEMKFTQLESSADYTVTVKAINGAGYGDPAFRIATTEPDNVGLIIGVVFAVLLVAVAGLAVWQRKNIKIFFSKKKDVVPPAPVVINTSLMVFTRKLGMKIKELKDGTLLSMEFDNLRMNSAKHSQEEALKMENKIKNRYMDILPFDRSLVKLNQRGSSYINASYVEDLIGLRTYIAAQGPKDNTIADFLSMIVENDVKIVIMLTKCLEKNRVKCSQYWPEDERKPLVFDDYRLDLLSIRRVGDLFVRKFTISYQNCKPHEVTQYHNMEWPDYGVPSKTTVLLNVLTNVKNDRKFKDCSGITKIVVHCSAGVGRTGTLIALWNIIDAVDREYNDLNDIYSEVLRIREYRPLLVQSKEQYYYLMKSVLHYILLNEKKTKDTDNELSHDYQNQVYKAEQDERLDIGSSLDSQPKLPVLKPAIHHQQEPAHNLKLSDLNHFNKPNVIPPPVPPRKKQL